MIQTTDPMVILNCILKRYAPLEIKEWEIQPDGHMKVTTDNGSFYVDKDDARTNHVYLHDAISWLCDEHIDETVDSMGKIDRLTVGPHCSFYFDSVGAFAYGFYEDPIADDDSDDYEDIHIDHVPSFTPRCTCGAKAVGSNMHTTWCDLS